ncbi:MAG: DUF262 domain-containing protein [Dehalococcoidia bacterium]
MSITPKGMSIQEAYRLYRDGSLLVNRRYQRKLVWTQEEKVLLVESIMKGFPIPLILLAARPKEPGESKYEIIDGVQRLNAIFAYIENAFHVSGKYFDVKEFTRAKLVADQGLFSQVSDDKPLLSQKECADLLDYQLAITIYPASSENDITDVFGRINSGGRQLSAQEKRQAGVITPFTEMVRKIASELRGDASKELLLLSEMPEISIESRRARQEYGLTAEEIFWCRQGIISSSDLRNSEDEEMIADIAFSILKGQPFARSREALDDLYNQDSAVFEEAHDKLALYSADRLTTEVKGVFSMLRETVEAHSDDQNALRNIVSPQSGNPIKTAFYAIFMAFFDLIANKQCVPGEPKDIMGALNDLQTQMQVAAHYVTTEDRIKNIDIVTGLLQRHFIKKDSPVLGHGAGLALDLENSLRRSSIETPRYEFKQGLLSLSPSREYSNEVVDKILETICGIANVGPEATGYIFVGVADKKEDAEKIRKLDRVFPIVVGQRYVVGIDREVSLLSISQAEYIERILNAIRFIKVN